MICEILAPAGSLDKLKVAFHYGADAVYLGGKAFNLRAKSSNFSNAHIKEAVSYAHSLGKRVYITLNILAHEREIKVLPQFIRFLEEAKVDAVIVADLGILDLVREHSNLPIHISTQASSTNHRSIKVYQKLGAKRVVLAREVTLDEMKRIKDHVPDIELEIFVHGAMCMTYSGRCNLSQYFSERDGNRGVCTNSCRWKYHIVEEKRPGEYFPVYEDDTGTYIYNSKDLCCVEFLDKIAEAGVTGFKIEGRMKSHYYCAMATKVYREALNTYEKGLWQVDPQWKAELQTMNHRGYTSGFYLGGLEKDSEQQKGLSYSTHRFAGWIKEKIDDHWSIMDVREKFDISKPLLYLNPKGRNVLVSIVEMIDHKKGNPVSIALPNMQVKIRFDQKVDLYDVFATDEPQDKIRPFTTLQPAAMTQKLHQDFHLS